MLRSRHSLTQLLGILLCFAVPACREDAADGSGIVDYELCDGSDRIRLGYRSGGGHVDEGYEFLHPYGYQFLFIDGRCDFIFAEYRVERPGSFMRGHLEPENAEAVSGELMLDALPSGVYFDQESCPDAGGESLVTSRFYGDCGCGCDADAPTALEGGLAALAGVLTTVRARGAAVSGDLEVAALAGDSAGSPDAAIAWPFSWPIADILNDTLNETTQPTKLRVLQGAEAETMRALLKEQPSSSEGPSALVQSGTARYRLFVRERVEPDLAGEITRFSSEADPRIARPITACGNDRDIQVEHSSANLYGQRLYTSFASLPVCGARICWDGELREREPVVAPLRVVKDESARACLGRPAPALAVSLEPIRDAFEASYPGAQLEIELALAGWTEEPLVLTGEL